MRPPLSSLSSVAPRLCPMWALSLASILLSLPPASVPQMPRFDLSSSVFPGQPRQPPAPVPGQGKRPRCPGPGEVPWCQCREDNSGLSVSCHNINQDGIARLRSSLRYHVTSLQLHDLAASVPHLSSWMLRNLTISNLGVIRSGLKDLDEDIFSEMEQSLVSLSLQHGRLTYVPRGVNKITSLKSLDLSGNNISELYPYSFYGASIAHLNLGHNTVITLSENAFLGLEGNLKSLNLKSNMFKSFPMSAVRNLQNLEELNLEMNEIEDIFWDSVSVLPSLQTLDLGSNKFIKILGGTLQAMPGIRRLKLSNNHINEIDRGALDHLEDLELLNLDQNRIVNLPSECFRHNKRLRTINLSNNHLRNIGELFSNLPSLESLDLDRNYLLSISDNVFSGSRQIRTLTLSNNNLYQISELAFKPLQKLNELYLSYNFLSRISEENFRHNIGLRSLSLAHNMIRSVQNRSFRGTPKLKKLLLQDNLLTEIKHDLFSGLASLTELGLQNNRLVSMEPHALSSLSSLQYLDLRGNKLPSLGDVMMRYPSSLVSIQIEDNLLSKFDENSFSGQTSLEMISLARNRLEIIPEKLFQELINLFRLSLVNNRIKEIEDKAFESCMQLRFLDLSLNQLQVLTKFTLYNLNQLEELNLRHNNIQTIEHGAFQALHHLKQLDLSHNSLASLGQGTLHGLRSVHTLKLHNSMLANIESGSLKSLSSIINLDIGYNYLTSIQHWSELEVLDKLQVLRASGNNFKNISRGLTLQKFPHLVQVEIENCQISELNGSFLRDNRELKLIKLGENFISSLPDEFFSKQVFLSSLSLASNHFTAVPGSAMKYLFNLQTLDLSGNLLTELNDSSFDDVTGLTVLDISDNLISLVTNRVFHNVTMLESLNLAGNHLMEFPTSTFLPLNKLNKLNVANNQLKHIPVALQGLREVKIMNISGNSIFRLKKVADSGGMMSSVTELYVTGTTMAEVAEDDMDLCPNLETLGLNDNRILVLQDNAFKSLHKLQDLDVSGNFIARLPGPALIGLTSLRTFNLSRNRLNQLDIFPTDLAELKILDLSFNEIGALEAKSFHYLINLVKLDLKSNKISQISPDVFLAEQSLKGLDLRSNRLEKLPYTAIDIVQNSMEALHIEGNPIVCSCHSFHQKLWLTQNRKWIDRKRDGDRVGPQCDAPESLSTRFLLTTKDAELCPLPSVSSFDIRNVSTNSVLIAWDSRDSNMTGLRGFLVAYHRLDTNDVVKKFQVAPSTRMFRLNSLMDDSVYLVCVVTQGSSYSDLNYQDNDLFSEAIRLEHHTEESEQFLLSDSTLLSAGSWNDNIVTDNILAPEIPSSNDTRYLITKPIVLNLDSQSSRCNKIKTPVDPSKINMVENKQLSALIGCSSGLMIFFCIIISIVARPKKHKEENIPVPDRSDSLPESYKSPSFKSRSDSLVYDKTSYCNSHSSSLTRLNGPEHEVRIRKDSNVSPINKNRADSRTATLQRNHKTRQISPQKKMSHQSSTESGPHNYNSKMSRQSSSDASGGAVRRTSNPRKSGERRHPGDHDGYGRQSGTLDRNRKGGGYGTYRRSGYEVGGGADDCIPMIEYSSAHSSPGQTLHVPRAGWAGTRASNGDSGVHSFNNSYEYEAGGGPGDIEVIPENFTHARNIHAAHR